MMKEVTGQVIVLFIMKDLACDRNLLFIMKDITLFFLALSLFSYYVGQEDESEGYVLVSNAVFIMRLS